MRRCAQMQDEIFARVCKKIKPGMRDNEVTALAQYEGRLLGSEQGLFLGSSAPLGQASNFVDRYMQGRVLQQGEHFSLLIENAGPGGMYTEIARTMVFGKASNTEMWQYYYHTYHAVDVSVPSRPILFPLFTALVEMVVGIRWWSPFVVNFISLWALFALVLGWAKRNLKPGLLPMPVTLLALLMSPCLSIAATSAAVTRSVV